LPGLASTSYRIELSHDGRAWRLAREVTGSDGGNDYIALPESEARYLRLTTLAGEGSSIGLAEFVVQPLAFSATPNDFLKAVASEAKRGAYPRGFSGEQPYWTIVGIDGGDEQGLIGEDGAIELGKGAFSIEPVVATPAGIADWSNVDSKQSLQDGYLPIPSVEWRRDDLRLRITSFARGTRAQSQLVGRYRLTNPTQAPVDYTLMLRIRPLQVNPPSQFLNTVGGISPIHRLRIVRSKDQPLAWHRTYVFDYTADGYSRQRGFVVLTGENVDTVGLGPRAV